MEDKTIPISVEEYKNLLDASVRISVFADFVNRSKYNIDREECARYLGFELTNTKK